MMMMMMMKMKNDGLKKMRTIYLCLVVLLLIPFCYCQKRENEMKLPLEEGEALRKIDQKLNIGWNHAVNPCISKNDTSWFRKKDDKYTGELDRGIERNISCDCNTITYICHVTRIFLMGQNLTGTLPEEFGNLTSLQILHLSRNNNISGTIPAAAWASAPLRIIELHGNRLTGIMPEDIGKIVTLENLVLENNLLNGSIPEGIGKLTRLIRLLLSGNNFIGELPKSLGNLKNLTDMRLDGNGISGNIPDFIGNFTLLKRLDLQGTSMKGAFPLSLSQLENLEELRVSDFSGDGKFPSLRSAKLKTLTLRNCSIFEKLPDYVAEMQNLENLDLGFNKIFGEIPESYGSLSRRIKIMFLNNNMITGLLPVWIAKSDTNLDVSYNNFTGSTTNLSQDTNKNFVASFSSQEKDDMINPYYKRNLSCPGNAENYEFYINCGGRKMNIGNIVYEDDFTSAGTSTFYVSESKRWAYSSTGSFPSGASQFTASSAAPLNITDSELYSSARLSASSLSYYGLCLQKGNYTVKLSFAEILFTNDNTFASLGRRIFDVSIQGQLKKKDFNIAEAANGTGRNITLTFDVGVEDGTLEINLRWAGKGTNAIPWRSVYGPLISAISVTQTSKPRQRGKKRSSFGVISAVSFPTATMIVLIVIFLSFYMRRRTKNKDLGSLDLLTGCYSLEQIKLATDGFSSRNKIGEGGFGPVYKGVLPSGAVIAVKQLSSRSSQGNHEFVNEIGIVSALQHPNLVKLLGYCIEGNQLLLIYEYMKNNCLARALFGSENMKSKLDWKTRCKICLGMARGLAYLHEESRLKIVHRDIKPSNILLDEDLNAKISDFGLAKLYEDGKSQSSTRIAGTIGYMAPEYTTRGHLTHKADVYSFGVVMLEILSGKSNANYGADEGFEYLLDWADSLKKEDRLLELVDPILGSNYSREEAQQLLTVSLACTNKFPSLRPKMSDVVMIFQDVMHVEASPIVHANIPMLSEGPEPKLCLMFPCGKKQSISLSTGLVNSS